MYIQIHCWKGRIESIELSLDLAGVSVLAVGTASVWAELEAPDVSEGKAYLKRILDRDFAGNRFTYHHSDDYVLTSDS